MWCSLRGFLLFFLFPLSRDALDCWRLNSINEWVLSLSRVHQTWRRVCVSAPPKSICNYQAYFSFSLFLTRKNKVVWVHPKVGEIVLGALFLSERWWFALPVLLPTSFFNFSNPTFIFSTNPFFSFFLFLFVCVCVGANEGIVRPKGDLAETSLSPLSFARYSNMRSPPPTPPLARCSTPLATTRQTHLTPYSLCSLRLLVDYTTTPLALV